MTNFIKNFRADESGAVTVDWVVLTAAVVGLGLAVMAVIGPKISDTAGNIGDALSGTTVTVPNIDDTLYQ